MTGMFRNRSAASTRAFVILLIFLFSVVLVPSAIHPVKASNSNLLYVSPGSQPNGGAVGSMVTVSVKVSQMDPFNTWDIQAKTKPNVLNPVSLSVTGNTLAANYSITYQELANCVNGIGTGCDQSKGDGPGVVHSAIFPLGSDPSTPSISGVLFTITYSVVNSTGIAGILLFNDQISSSSNGLLTHTTKNGIYGPGKLPNVDFYWTPSDPALGRVNFFSNSSDPNLGGSLQTNGYVWDFGDGTGSHFQSPANVTNVYSVRSGGTPLNSTCGAPLKFVVQLTATDSLEISNSQTHILLIKSKRTYDLSVASVGVAPGDSVIPVDAFFAGTSMTINVRIAELGTLNVDNFNVSVFIEHRPLPNGNATFDSKVAGGPLGCTAANVFKFPWNTSGLSPRAYEVEVFVSPVRNATSLTHEILELSVENNMLSHLVRIIMPMGSTTLPLTLPESLGAVAIVIGGIVVAKMAVSKNQLRKRREAEELP